MPCKGCSEIPPIDSVVFNRAGVEHLLKNLDSKKANGPDKLPTTLLKIAASEIAEVVTFLFNQSYDSGELPEDWRNAPCSPNLQERGKAQPQQLSASIANYCSMQIDGTRCI